MLNNNLFKEINEYLNNNFDGEDFNSELEKERKINNLPLFSFLGRSNSNPVCHQSNNIQLIEVNLDNENISCKEKTWSERVLDYMIEKDLNSPDVYKKVYISKQTFSKVISLKDYHPGKETAIQVCFGLKLNLDESLELLESAGYTLSKSIISDLIIRYYLDNKIYDIEKVNDTLYEYNLKLLY